MNPVYHKTRLYHSLVMMLTVCDKAYMHIFYEGYEEDIIIRTTRRSRREYTDASNLKEIWLYFIEII